MPKPTEEQAEKIEMTIEGVKELYENDQQGQLSDFEASFMASMQERWEQYGSNTFVSPKQMNVIDSIYEKVCVI